MFLKILLKHCSWIPNRNGWYLSLRSWTIFPVHPQSFPFLLLKQDWTRLNKIEQDWTSLNKIKQDWTRLNKVEQDWSRLDKIEQDWTRLNKIEQNWTIMIYIFESCQKNGMGIGKNPISLMLATLAYNTVVQIWVVLKKLFYKPQEFHF